MSLEWVAKKGGYERYELKYNGKMLSAIERNILGDGCWYAVPGKGIWFPEVTHDGDLNLPMVLGNEPMTEQMLDAIKNRVENMMLAHFKKAKMDAEEAFFDFEASMYEERRNRVQVENPISEHDISREDVAEEEPDL